jgi:hypothetical protein
VSGVRANDAFSGEERGTLRRRSFMPKTENNRHASWDCARYPGWHVSRRRPASVAFGGIDPQFPKDGRRLNVARGRDIWRARHVFWLLAVYAGEHRDLKPLVMSMKPECCVYAMWFLLGKCGTSWT